MLALCVWVSEGVRECVRILLYVHVCLWVYVGVSVCVCVYVCVCVAAWRVCVHMYLCM